MKGRNGAFLFILWALLGMGTYSCDTAANIEDPDLHYFVKYYGDDGNQRGVDMLALGDGSFLLLGNSSLTNFDSDIYLVKVDVQGEIIWEKKYRQDIQDIYPGVVLDILSPRDIESTVDGNFIILADFPNASGANTDLLLIKISPDGAILDSKTFGTPVNDDGKTVTPLDDGGFIVSGTTELDLSSDPDLGNFFNFRFDGNLEEVSVSNWSPVIFGYTPRLDVAVKAVQRPDKPDEFYVFGYTNSNIGNNNPAERKGLFYFKRNSALAGGGFSDPYFPGNIVNVNDTEIQFVEQVAPELGDGFIIIGTSQNNTGNSEIFIAKLRSSLTFGQSDATLYNTIKLQRNLRGVSAASSISDPRTLGYLVLGNEVRNTGSTGALNIWLSKIDQAGNVIWSSTFGSEAENDSAAAVRELPDGKIIILGTMGLADNQFKMAFIKLNPRGELLK